MSEDGATIRYQGIISELGKAVRTDTAGLFIENKNLALTPPWRLVNTDSVKFTAANDEEGIFVKTYAPVCETKSQYLRRAFAALLELSDLSLSTPVLAPLDRCDNSFIFPLGSPIGNKAVRMLPQEDTDSMNKVLQKHELEPLDKFFLMSVVSVGGKEYLADPFDDSARVILAQH